MGETTLIVGACQAGVQLAATLRELGDPDPIVMIGEEAHRPYQRPPLSKGWLKGELEPDDVVLRTRQWFDDRDIALIGGDRVVTIHREPGGTGVAHTLGGRQVAFTRLALTTGASVRRLTLPGTDYRGVHYLRDADDAISLRPALAEPGAERVVAEPTSDFYLAAHRRRGTEVLLGARLARILGEDASAAGRRGSVTGVELEDGRVIPADLVVIGIGVIPRVELAVQLGLDVAGGIVVDEACRTSDGRTVAAGDCAIMPNPYPGGMGGLVRIESVNNALEQAKIAAATLLGRDASYSTVPWFWSDQAALKLQIAGLSAGYDAVVVRGDPAAEKFAVLYYRDGRLIAADCVNQPAEFLAIKQALSKGKTIPPLAAADTGVPLKLSVIDAPVAVAS
jgi:3-phenylpropionate/trans-cinnamate dioxygenase ferredoxin reductase subunit